MFCSVYGIISLNKPKAKPSSCLCLGNQRGMAVEGNSSRIESSLLLMGEVKGGEGHRTGSDEKKMRTSGVGNVGTRLDSW